MKEGGGMTLLCAVVGYLNFAPEKATFNRQHICIDTQYPYLAGT